jgi:hypothetical protein
MNINYIAIINGVNQEKGKVFQPQNPKSKIKKLDEEEEMRITEFDYLKEAIKKLIYSIEQNNLS